MLAVALYITLPPGYSATTVLQFAPGHSVHARNDSFAVNVAVSDVVDLNSVYLTISFDSGMLSCAGLGGWNDSDSMFAGHTITVLGPDIDNALGTIIVTAGLDWGVGVSGSGKLCAIQFQAISLGAAQLAFKNVMKVQPDGTFLRDVTDSTIPFTASLGIVEVVASDFHESIFDVTQGAQLYHVVMHTNSTISNFSFNQTSKEMAFSVTGSSSTQGADIVTIPKPLLNSTLVVLMDNAAINNYFSDVKALPENETCCFTYFNYTQSTHNIKIRLTVPGDITGDRKDDAKDVSLTASAFGSSPGSPKWKSIADVDKNLKIDAKDIAFIAKNFGKKLQL
jgi:hypothetical protein